MKVDMHPEETNTYFEFGIKSETLELHEIQMKEQPWLSYRDSNPRPFSISLAPNFNQWAPALWLSFTNPCFYQLHHIQYALCITVPATCI